MAAPLRSKLIFEQEGKAQEVELGQSPLTLGRSDTCDIVLRDPSVSRRHAELILMDGAWYVCEISSKNGTYLNGRQVKRARLEDGDRLGVGSVELSFTRESRGSEVCFTESGFEETVMISALSLQGAGLVGDGTVDLSAKGPSSEGEKVHRLNALPSSHSTPDHANVTSSPAGETVSLS